MHPTHPRPAAPARVRAALAALAAVERDARITGDHLAADLARRARVGVERRLTAPTLGVAA